MQFPSGIEIDRVDEEVGMDVLTVCVGADQNFVSLIVLGQLQRGRVSGDRVDCFANSLMASRSVDAMRVLNLTSFFMSFPPNRR